MGAVLQVVIFAAAACLLVGTVSGWRRRVLYRVALGGLAASVVLAALMVDAAIGTTDPILGMAGVHILFLLLSYKLASRRGDQVLGFMLSWLTVFTLGVVWGFRLLASDQIPLVRTALFLTVAAAVILAMLSWPLLGRLLEGTPSWFLGLAGLGLLALPLLTVSRVNGAFIDVDIPFVGTVQPGDLGRLLLIVWVARSVAYRRPALVGVPGGLRQQAGLLWSVTSPVIVGVVVGILSNDLGPALVLLLASLIIVFVGGLGWRYLAIVAGLGAAGLVLIIRVSSKVAERFAMLSDPLGLAAGGGLEQIGLGLVAMAHGPTGLGEGVPNMIPEWKTDMILAAMGHELGLVTLITVLVATAVSVLTAWRLLIRINDDRAQLTVVGITGALATQTLMMVGAVLAVVPLTGMPVPLLSLSGSSLLSSAVAVALVLASSNSHDGVISTSLTIKRRSALWAATYCLLVVGLAAKVIAVGISSDTTLQSVEGRDPIGNRLASGAVGAVITSDEKVMATTVSSDGKQIRPANADRELSHEMFSTVLGSPEFPGLDSRLGKSADCRAGDCPTTQTTLVYSAQLAAWEGLRGKTGSVVAVDLNTGGILAYLSAVEGVSTMQPDRIRTVTIAPGSTAKLLTAAAAVSEGLTLQRREVSQYGDVHSMNGRPCGSNLNEAMATSCNPYFAALGDELGVDRLGGLTDSWLNSQTSIDGMPVAVSTLVGEADEASFAALGAIGLGNAHVTPIAMLSATAQIARGGEPLCMHLLLENSRPCAAQESMPADAAVAAAKSMREVVTSGTARNVPGIQDLEAAAKTGTADFTETYNNATFVAFAPATDPQVAVVVFIEPGPDQQTGLTGGLDAGPIAVEVLKAAIR